MKLSREEVEHVARLARLAVTESEIEVFQKQLSDILNYIGKLNELETGDVEPTSHVLDIRNVFREDEVRPGLTTEQALSGAPEPSDGYFRVPKIIEERE
jgi:aspartyl-tRNA(Asn)/glutamyl-tRNA(Gln) amidotransferase subunit C